MPKEQLNSNLSRAKAAKNDEFYTRLKDIEKELGHYKHHFRGQVVYCNCDDPRESKFFHYFSHNFERLGLKKLIATCYKSQDRDFFSREDSEKAIYLEYDGAKKGERVPDPEEIGITRLKSDGDFRNEEMIELLKQVDIVVTNPPFSLFREYVAQLMEYDKKFIIIGNQNAITYKETFTLLKDNKLWTGVNSGGMEFRIPDHAEERETGFRQDEDGQKWRIFGNITWYTNLDNSKRNENLILYKRYTPEDYPKYDNYDAIEVYKIKEIPKDYDGAMGVPITFINNYNPDQFEVLGITSGRDEFEASPTKRYKNPKQINLDGSITNGSKANTRATLISADKPDEGIYYTADNADGYLSIFYARIIIRRKK